MSRTLLVRLSSKDFFEISVGFRGRISAVIAPVSKNSPITPKAASHRIARTPSISYILSRLRHRNLVTLVMTVEIRLESHASWAECWKVTEASSKPLRIHCWNSSQSAELFQPGSLK
jgi:hypothetical protein